MIKAATRFCPLLYVALHFFINFGFLNAKEKRPAAVGLETRAWWQITKTTAHKVNLAKHITECWSSIHTTERYTCVHPGTSRSPKPGPSWREERWEVMDGSVVQHKWGKGFFFLVGGERWRETMGKRGGGSGLGPPTNEVVWSLHCSPESKTMPAGSCAPH